MKINGKENINEITLRHKGRDIKFECFIKPFPYAERLDLKEKDPVEIVFDDLTEVDALIDMLKRFKQESQEYIGVWKRIIWILCGNQIKIKNDKNPVFHWLVKLSREYISGGEKWITLQDVNMMERLITK